MNKHRKSYLCVVWLVMLGLFCFSCSDGSSSSTGDETYESESGGSSSSGYIYVALTHSGISGKTLLSKKVSIAGESVSSNGTGKSSYTKVNVSGRCSYTTYQSYSTSSKAGTKSTYNERTGGGTYTFSNGGRYTIDCKNGSISKN